MDLIDEALEILEVVNDPKYKENNQLVHLHPDVVRKVIGLLRRYKDGNTNTDMAEVDKVKTSIKVYGIKGIETDDGKEN